MSPAFKTYHKARVMETVWYWHKNGHTHQCKRTESPEINSYVYGPKKTMQKRESFQKTVLEQIDIIIIKNELRPYTSYTNINLKCTIDPNARAKTIHLLEENTEENLCDFGSGKEFLNTKNTTHKRRK